MDNSAHLSPASTPTASARLCHSLRGRTDDGGGGSEDGDGGARALVDLSEASAATAPPIGQKAYTVFLGFLERNAWRSSSACRCRGGLFRGQEKTREGTIPLEACYGRGALKLSEACVGRGAPKLYEACFGRGAPKLSEACFGRGAPKMSEACFGRGAPKLS